MIRSRTLCLAGLATALLFLPAARAASPDNLIPGDSTLVMTINVKQILDAPLVKKHGVPAAKEALKGIDEANEILKDLGFDPFTDLDRVTFASPGGTDKDRGLIIVRGRFDVDKFKARAEKAAKDDGEILKIGKGGGKTIYELNLPGEGMPVFVALLNNSTLVASPGKDYIRDAIKKEASEAKEVFKNKDFQAVLSRLDLNQSIAFAAVAAAFEGGELGPAGEMLKKVDAAGGGLTLSDELKLQVVLSAKTADDADKVKDTINEGINAGIGFLGLAVGNRKELEPVLDILKSVKATSKDKTVTLKVRIDSDVLEKISEKSDK
jgi:hypothetical protein